MVENYPAKRVQQAYDAVKSIQPDCMVAMHCPGAEHLKHWPTDVFQPGPKLLPYEKHNPKMEYNGKTYYIPLDILNIFMEGWFWRPNAKLESLEVLLSRYRDITGTGANFTLNGIAIDREGKVPGEQMELLAKLAEEIEKS